MHPDRGIGAPSPPRLPRAEAIRVVDRLWTYALGHINNDAVGLLMDQTLEAMERLGALESVKMAVEDLFRVADVDAERALRSLRSLITRADEPWLLDVIRRAPSQDKRRALEMAAYAGGESSIKLLEPFLACDVASWREVAFWATSRIYRRGGVVWYGGLDESPIDMR
jgi:hypothetical protein